MPLARNHINTLRRARRLQLSKISLTVLESDTKLLREQKSFNDAVAELTKRLSASRAFTPEDSQEEYTDVPAFDPLLDVLCKRRKRLDRSGCGSRI